MSGWQLYDELIEGIPPDCKVDDLICGTHFAAVRSGDATGISAVLTEDTIPLMLRRKSPGMSLRQLAGCIKSWNFIEASIGQAAINAYYNSVTVCQSNGVEVADSQHTEDRIYDPFIMYQNAIRNKKVAVVKHFPYVEQLFQPICDLSVLSLYPEMGEYPISAAEYIIPECDFVFITCNTFIDKTLPQLLKLSSKAKVIVVGPSTPMAPALAKYGVADLSGFVVKDGERAFCMCGGQESGRIYSTGQKVSLKLEAAPIETS
jgi:Uncharacterized conserved protein